MKLKYSFLDYDLFLEFIDGQRPERGEAIDGSVYNFWFIVLDGKGHTIVEYSEDENNGVLPDHIWHEIIVAPPVGMGTDLLQTQDILLCPLIVVNKNNEELFKRFQNDGIVMFQTGFEAEAKNDLEDFVLNQSKEDFFEVLGENIIKSLKKTMNRMQCDYFLITKPDDDETK